MSEKTEYKQLVDTIVIESPTKSIEIPYQKEDYIYYPQVTCYPTRGEEACCDGQALFNLEIHPQLVRIDFFGYFVGTIYLGNDILRTY